MMENTCDRLEWTILLNDNLNTACNRYVFKHDAQRDMKRMEESGEFKGIKLSLELVRVTTLRASEEDHKKYADQLKMLDDLKAQKF